MGARIICALLGLTLGFLGFWVGTKAKTQVNAWSIIIGSMIILYPIYYFLHSLLFAVYYVSFISASLYHGYLWKESSDAYSSREDLLNLPDNDDFKI